MPLRSRRHSEVAGFPAFHGSDGSPQSNFRPITGARHHAGLNRQQARGERKKHNRGPRNEDQDHAHRQARDGQNDIQRSPERRLTRGAPLVAVVFSLEASAGFELLELPPVLRPQPCLIALACGPVLRIAATLRGVAPFS